MLAILQLTADGVALLDLLALLDPDLDDNTRHGRTDRPWVVGRLFARHGLDRGVLILDGYRTDLSDIFSYKCHIGSFEGDVPRR